MKNFEVKMQSPSFNERLNNTGIEKSELEKFKSLIEKTKFVNIDIDSNSNAIHIDMVASLLSRQENGEIFLQNILKEINHEWNQIDEFLISTTKEITSESIDMDIGTNRRVDKFECVFSDGIKYLFTLSADLDNHNDKNDSNSFVEKEIFESPIAENNPWLQKYFGYSENEMSKHHYRMIAKEYLPGKNIAQYCNELEEKEELTSSFINVTCELGYSIGGLYRKMNGRLLEDLKLENIVYNDKNPNGNNPACRICDNSGLYEDKPKIRSVSQILANIQSLISLYYLKSTYLGNGKNVDKQRNDAVTAIASSYIDSFIGEIGDELTKVFIEQLNYLKKQNENDRQFNISDDLLDFTINYLN